MASISSPDPGPKAEVGCSDGGGGESSETVRANDEKMLYRGFKKAKKERGCTAKERISKMPPCTAGKRSSIYRGVTRHRWTGRYEAHLWDKSTWNQNQNKKGKQVYLGAYDEEEAAARAYDLAALKYWGAATLINFPVSDYTRDLEEMQNVSREEYLASLRRSSGKKKQCFFKGNSKTSRDSKSLASVPFLNSSEIFQTSRWDASASRMHGPENFSNVHYGDERVTEGDFLGSFCLEGKIDMTGYIKWWGIKKTRQTEDTKLEDISRELKTLEQVSQTTKLYKEPSLGVPCEKGKERASSALSILSQSPAYKNLQEKIKENNENTDQKNIVERDKSYGKAIEKKPVVSHGSSGLCPITSTLSAPLLTNCNPLDPLADAAVTWTPFVPSLLPTGSSHTSEVTKTDELFNLQLPSTR